MGRAPENGVQRMGAGPRSVGLDFLFEISFLAWILFVCGEIGGDTVEGRGVRLKYFWVRRLIGGQSRGQYSRLRAWNAAWETLHHHHSFGSMGRVRILG